MNSSTYTYTRSNGYGGTESRTTTVNRATGTCQSLITRTDGSGRVYSDVITGPGCDNTGDYYRGGPRNVMYSNNCYYTAAPTLVAPSDPTTSAPAPEAPAAPPADQQMMPPVPVTMGTVPVYSYNTGMPVLPTGTACGYAQGYGFYR